MSYDATVLEHFRRPRNQGSLPGATQSGDGANPLCGDRVRIELDVRDARIHAAAFTANACAICTAAASLLTEQLTGLGIDAAARISDAELMTSLGVGVPAARQSCATLPLRALRAALGAPTAPGAAP